MDPRPFHFDYRAPPRSPSPTYNSSRFYEFLQPEASSNRSSNSRASQLSSFKLSRQNDQLQQRERLRGQKGLEQNLLLRNHEKDDQNLENSLQPNNEEQQLQKTANGYKKNSITPVTYSAEKQIPSMYGMRKNYRRNYSSLQQIAKPKQDYSYPYNQNLVPKSRYDPIRGGDFIDNNRIQSRLNSSLSKYGADLLRDSSPNSRVSSDYYHRFFFDQRHILQKQQRPFNIINCEHSDASRQNTGLSGRRQGFRRLGVLK